MSANRTKRLTALLMVVLMCFGDLFTTASGACAVHTWNRDYSTHHRSYFTCGACGAATSTDNTNVTEVIRTAVTCEDAGRSKFSFTVNWPDGKTTKDEITVDVAPAGHTWEKETLQRMKTRWKCGKCGKTQWTDNIIDLDAPKVTDPTCTKDGQKYWDLTRVSPDGTKYPGGSTEKILALGHGSTSEWRTVKEVTYTETGRMELVCTAKWNGVVCGHVIETKEIAKLMPTATPKPSETPGGNTAETNVPSVTPGGNTAETDVPSVTPEGDTPGTTDPAAVSEEDPSVPETPDAHGETVPGNTAGSSADAWDRDQKGHFVFTIRVDGVLYTICPICGDFSGGVSFAPFDGVTGAVGGITLYTFRADMPWGEDAVTGDDCADEKVTVLSAFTLVRGNGEEIIPFGAVWRSSCRSLRKARVWYG